LDQTLKAQQHLDVIQKKIIQLEEKAAHDPEVHLQLKHLQHQVEFLRAQIREHVDSWRKTDLSRHSQRPYTLDYVKRLFANWNEIHGDRCFGDDPAIVCGMAKYHGEQVMVIGQQKGRTTKERVFRNFSQANPEGYRKALRCMKMAEKFARPVFTFVDTQGAYPGIEAEERGQGEAIARNLREMARLTVPTIATVIGEGTSGGALAIAVADRVLMMENAIYSVISPEGCASIIWRDSNKKKIAAKALRLTAVDLKELGIIDEIIPEPGAGAHTDHDAAAALVDEALQRNYEGLKNKSNSELLDERYKKFRQMALFFTE
jgi:acetyl-CoA carboxylase carboxyl transferase subunit alpha